MVPPPKPEQSRRQRASDARLEQLRQRLCAIVARVSPAWLAHEREDLVQTALIRIVGLHGNRLELDGLAATYLWKTAYSVILDEVRKARWKSERPADDSTPESHAAPTSDPERAAAARETSAGIHDCLLRLEPSRRRAVVLHLAGFARTEISALVGRTTKATDNLIFRGTRDLRACLEAKGLKP
jgi:RNA polymerase sigma factor (sigma-70 family)